MKKLLLLTFIFYNYLLAQNKFYEFNFKINNLKNSHIFFGYHFGDNKYVTDTIYLNSKGEGFLKKETLPQGIYFIALPNMKYTNFLVLEKQLYKISTDTSNLLRNLVVENNKENEIFIDYQIKLNNYKQVISKIKKQIKQYPDSEKFLLQNISQEEKLWENYVSNIISNYPNFFSTKIIKSLKSKDFTFDAEKYFEHIDFYDERLLFSPVFSTVIDNFFTSIPGLTINNIDSLYKAIDYILMTSIKNTSIYEELSKYLISQFDLSGNYPNPDAFWYLADKYFLTDLIPWVNDAFKAKLSKYNKHLKKIIISEKFPGLTLYNDKDQIVKFPNNNNLHTIIVFWDPECEHCLNYLRQLKKIMQTYKDKIEIYAVLTGTNTNLWKKVIHEEAFTWYNLYDRKLLNDFVEELFLHNTPQIFLLDQNKKIIAKDLLPEEIINWIKL